MIICPHCKNALIIKPDTINCSNCNHSIENIDGIWRFNAEIKENHTDYNADDLEILAKYEEKHFWFKRRRDFIKFFIQKYIPKTKTFIEIGAGTSFIAKDLQKHGYDVSVGDMHINGLKMVKNSNITKLYQFDLLSSPFKDEFDFVGMFDVLEHIEDEKHALFNIHQLLKENGYLVLTVPAHEWLWGEYDIIANHKRRYSSSDLAKLLSENGFKIIDSKNFFITLIPALLLRTAIQKKTTSSTQIIDNNLKINPLVNYLLDFITSIEFQMLKYLPCKIGGSIIVIAQKEG